MAVLGFATLTGFAFRAVIVGFLALSKPCQPHQKCALKVSTRSAPFRHRLLIGKRTSGGAGGNRTPVQHASTLESAGLSTSYGYALRADESPSCSPISTTVLLKGGRAGSISWPRRRLHWGAAVDGVNYTIRCYACQHPKVSLLVFFLYTCFAPLGRRSRHGSDRRKKARSGRAGGVMLCAQGLSRRSLQTLNGATDRLGSPCRRRNPG